MQRQHFVLLVCLVVAGVTAHSAPTAADERLTRSLSQVGNLLAKPSANGGRRTAAVMLQHTASNATATCDSLRTAASNRLLNNTECVVLLDHFNQTRVDIEFICDNSCWRPMLTEVIKMHNMGCPFEHDDVDLDVLKAMCTDTLCSVPQARQCITEWVGDGCPDQHARATCSLYSKCYAAHISECAAEPTPEPLSPCANGCSGHGICDKKNASQTGHCRCDKGYGRSTFGAVQDCSEYTLDMCPDSCHGHGVCLPTINGTMRCKCYDGFHGDNCDRITRCERLDFCSGHGICTRSYPLYNASAEACTCIAGWMGETCNVLESATCPANCSGHGSCQFNGRHHSCSCDRDYEGASCNDFTGEECPYGCSGFGECTDNGCECSRGFTGSHCDRVELMCTGGCRHGFCRSQGCECIPGFSGQLCNVYNANHDTGCSDLNFCSGYGVCNRDYQRSTHTWKYSCTCFEGFSGSDCSQVDANYENQCPDYCSGHGTCVLIESPHCVCKPGWKGNNCGTSECPLGNGDVCSGNGVCEKPGNSSNFHCSCDRGYNNGAVGACETSMCTNDCNGNGKCVGPEQCSCNDGFSGSDCSTVVQNATKRVVALAVAPAQAPPAPVAAPPAPATPIIDASLHRDDEEDGDVVDPSMCLRECSHRGECVMGKCSCRAGYSGDDCSEELPSLYEEDGLDSLDMLELRSDSKPAVAMKSLWD